MRPAMFQPSVCIIWSQYWTDFIIWGHYGTYVRSTGVGGSVLSWAWCFCATLIYHWHSRTFLLHRTGVVVVSNVSNTSKIFPTPTFLYHSRSLEGEPKIFSPFQFPFSVRCTLSVFVGWQLLYGITQSPCALFNFASPACRSTCQNYARFCFPS